MRTIRLNEEEKQQLTELQKTSVNSVVRKRCLYLLLSDNLYSMKEISSITNVHWETVSRLFDSWERATREQKLSVLSIAPGRGAKVKLNEVKDLLPELVEKHSRNLNPILAILEKEYNIKVCKSTLQNFLKGAGF